MRYDVFLSYSEADREKAGQIKQACAKKGLSCFLSAEEIPPGARWAETIRMAIEESDHFFVLVTPKSLRSPWVAAEWGAAWGMQKPVTPILDGCEPKQIPEPYRESHVVADWERLDHHISTLAVRHPIQLRGIARELYLFDPGRNDMNPVEAPRAYRVEEGRLYIWEGEQRAEFRHHFSIIEGEDKGEYDFHGVGFVCNNSVEMTYRVTASQKRRLGWAGIMSLFLPTFHAIWLAKAERYPGCYWLGEADMEETE